MKVLICCVNRFDHPSGLCRFAANLALCLATSSQIDKVTVVVGRWQMPHFLNCFQLSNPKIELIQALCDNTLLSRYIWYYRGLQKLINIHNPDVFHFSFPLPFNSRSIGVPTVTTVHDVYAYDAPSTIGFPNVFMSRHILRSSVKKSSAIVCISRFTQTRLQHYFPTMNKKIYQAVIYQYVQKLVPPSNRQSERPPFILSVAQHHSNKNLDILIRAFGILHGNGNISSDTRLYLVGGTGSQTEILESIVKEIGLADRVDMLGTINDAELAKLYADCDVFATTSSIEGFCLPAVEASMMSARIVSSDIPVLREVCGDCATYFSLHGDPVINLANAIRYALDLPKSKLNPLLMRYSLANCRDSYLCLYRYLMNSQTAPLLKS